MTRMLSFCLMIADRHLEQRFIKVITMTERNLSYIGIVIYVQPVTDGTLKGGYEI
jgi:hypothetical protein